MADPTKSPAAGTQSPQRMSEKDIEHLRDIEATGGVRKVPKPEHGDPTEGNPPAPGETVLGVRVGSEAAVESGTDPVLPFVGGALSEMTRVRNRDLQERDQREWRKRGRKSDGTALASVPVSVSFEGLMAIESKSKELKDDERVTFVSGSYTGFIPAEGLLIRPLTEDEMETHFPSPQPGAGQRANDLVKGSGTGGGGNPMHAGRARGTSSETAARVGQGGVTSEAGKSPPPRPEGPVSGTGGGTTSRNRG